MPIYEYVCDQCGDVLEVLQKISDPAPVDCPSGDGGALRRVLSAHNVGGSGSVGGSGRVGGPGSAFQAPACERAQVPTCGQCGMAGTGCSGLPKSKP